MNEKQKEENTKKVIAAEIAEKDAHAELDAALEADEEFSDSESQAWVRSAQANALAKSVRAATLRAAVAVA